MSSYAGRHAELYDLFYQDKSYVEEARFVHRCLTNFGSGKTERILELACGTGGHAFELEKLGYAITATDYSSDMIRVGQDRAKTRGSSVSFRLQDMRALDAPETPYDAIICLFDSIGYLQTNSALAETISGVHRNLRDEGLFIFEFWHAAAMLSHYSPVRVRRWNTPDSEIVRISETVLDVKKQLAHVDYTVIELRTDGTYSCLQERQTNRYFLVQEMAAFILAGGLEPVRFFAGFAENEVIDLQTWHVVALVRKSNARHVTKR